MKNNFSRILWGVGLLAAAVLLVVSQLGLLSFKIGFWMIILTVIFVACLIKGLMDRSIYVSIFSIGFLVITYSGPLGIKKLLSAWMILFIALLVSMGLSLLLKRDFRPKITIEKSFNWDDDDDSSDDDTETTVVHHHVQDMIEDGDNIVINQKMAGDSSRYIHSQNLQSINLEASFGNANIYLDDAKAAGDTVVLNLTASMGNVNLYVPLSWRIDNQLSVSLGNVIVKGKSNGGGPTLVLKGRANMGNVVINYV